MKRVVKFLFLIAIALLVSLGTVNASTYEKTDLGIKIGTQTMNVEIQFYSPTIVRVLKTPQGIQNGKKSLSVIKVPEKTNLKISDDGQFVTISSNSMKVNCNLATAGMAFFDEKSNRLFAESENGTSFTPTMDATKKAFMVKQSFVLDQDEAIYGLGQQQNGHLNQRGKSVVLKNENMRVGIPFFQSTKGYGIFWDNYASTLFTDTLQETSFESLGECADYYFMYGALGDGIVAQMRDLTGQVPMLPLWAFGYMQSKERYRNQKELVGVVEKYRELNVPIDYVIQDWQYWGRDSIWNAMSFNSQRFPDPKAMVDRIHELNARLMIVSWPGFGPLTDQYKEFAKKNMLIKFDTWPYNSGTTVYDPYNPEARDIYWKYLNKGVFSLNIDGWWLDSSEPDHFNQKEQDFDQPTYLGTYRSVVNAYPLEHVKGIYEHQRATTSDKRVFILTRSAFAGQQRYGANTWSGDVISNWETLQKQIPAGLSFALTGNPYWNADIGGFFLWEQGGSKALKEKTYHELYVRWIQFGTFSPMMRSHGTDAPREIYQFGKQGDWSYDAIEKFINFRYQLLPYIYATAWDVSSNSGSFMRPLLSDFASDKEVQNLTDEFMFGRSILVAPVLTAMYVSKVDSNTIENFKTIKTRRVYLPKGAEWVDFWTAEKLQGGQFVEKAAPIDMIPLYVKAGSILPWGPKVQYASEKNWDNLELRIYPGANAEFTLYEDENDNYNYEKGLKSTITMRWNDQSKTLTIDARKGSFNGMLKTRTFNIVVVSKPNGLGVNAALKFRKTVTYNGKSQKIKM